MADQAPAQAAPNDLTTLTLADLHERQQIAIEMATQAKTAVAEFQTEIDNRLSSSAKATFVQAGKEYGTKTLPLQGGLEAKVEIKKTVDWDSEKLLTLAMTMPWERVRQLFKVEFSMGETLYKG